MCLICDRIKMIREDSTGRQGKDSVFRRNVSGCGGSFQCFWSGKNVQ